MAIFLVKDRDATHVDPDKDERGCYKRGDIVAVYPDDTPVVRPPAPPFVIVKITGLSVEQAEAYAQPETDVDHNVIRRRKFGVAWSSLPLAVRNALTSDRYYETTWAAVRAYVRNKRTGAGE